MEILLTNDDGIHAPGLQALYDELTRLGNVTVTAPAIEQSGVGHTVTYLHPLLVHDEFRGGARFGWKVEGSPADCVKLGILEFCPRTPDLVVSGINSGSNVGINVLYSGTVAAAIEGAFFGVTSVAVSLWCNTPPDYPRGARIAVGLIEQLLARNPARGSLWNVNLPSSKSDWPRGVRVVSMGINRETDVVEKRIDPRGRIYYWSGLEPIKGHHLEPGTDVHALTEGYVTITPLHFDLTESDVVAGFKDAEWSLPVS